MLPGHSDWNASSWVLGNEAWLQKIAEDCGPGVQVWIYNYPYLSATQPIFKLLETRAHELVARLKVLCAEADPPRPLLFVCHSLGGLLFKQAWRVMRNHNLEDLEVVNVVSGVCFISTPHLRTNLSLQYNVLELMVRAIIRQKPFRNAVTSNDNNSIAELSTYFANNIYRVPIVTICESVETTLIYQPRFAKFLKKSRHIYIVPADRSKIGVEAEEGPIEIPKPHDQTCRMSTDDPAYHLLLEHLRQVLSHAPALITGTTPEGAPIGLEKMSLVSHTEKAASVAPVRNSIPVEETDSKQSSLSPVRATAGSTDISYVKVAEEPDKTHDTDENKRNDTEVALESKLDPKFPCFSVPEERTKQFHGREDILAMIDETLLSERKTQDNEPTQVAATIRSFAICGMGGIGKTSVALRYAHTRRKDFHAILWIKATQKETLALEFARAAADLGIVTQEQAEDVLVAAQTLKDWLFRPLMSYSATDVVSKDASWLLIFDNVDDFETLIDYWPGPCAGSILVTSRDPLAKHQVYTVNDGIDLKPFSPSESSEFIRLMTKSLPQRGQEDALDKVVLLLGGLPLLVDSMTGVMNNLRLSYGDFLRLVTKSGLQNIQVSQTQGSNPEDYYNIFFSIGFDKLSPQALGLLQTLAFFDPDNVLEELFENCRLERPENCFFPTELNDYYQARSQLLQSSLVHYDEANRALNLHRVVQTIARQKLQDFEKVAYLNFVIMLISTVWPFQSLQNRFNTSRYEKCALVFNHVLHVMTLYEQMSDDLGKVMAPSLKAAALFNDAGW